MKPSQLLDELNEADEGQRIEAKRASEIGKSIMETVSAFSNTSGMGGGYLLLGVTRSQADLFEARYEPEGVSDPDKISADLATQCASMLNERVRPVIEREEVSPGRVLVSAYIPEAPPERKPVYIESRKLPEGAFLRVGTTDQKCNRDDIARLFQEAAVRPFDATLLDGTSEADASELALANYRRARRERDPNAPELDYDDAKLLRSLRMVQQDARGVYRFTVAGLLLFGRTEALADVFPAVRTDYIRVQGRTWVPSAEDRFTSLDLYGPVFEIVYRLEAAIMDDLPARFTLPEGSLHRVDVPLLPRTVVREALVNALMHRDYREHSPVQLVRYSNRIEFRNAGYSLKPEEELGTEGSALRNPSLARVLHQTRLAETKGSGIQTMRETMRAADLTPPTFSSSRASNTFVATLLMLHVLEPETLQWLARFEALGLSREDRQALVFARETLKIQNEDYRNLNDVDTLTASKALVRLRDLGLLAQHDKGAATYYTPTDRLLDPEGQPLGVAGEPLQVDSQQLGVEGEPLQVDSQQLGVEREALFSSLPEDLRQHVLALGRKAGYGDLRSVIEQVCRRNAWSAQDLSVLLDRSYGHLLQRHLGPMVQQGRLVRTQSNPSAPNQTYRATDADD